MVIAHAIAIIINITITITIIITTATTAFISSQIILLLSSFVNCQLTVLVCELLSVKPNQTELS